MTGLIIFFQCIQYNLEMFFIAKKVSVGCVYKQGFDAMLFDVAGIGFLKFKEVIVRNGLLVGTVSFVYIFLQLLYRCVQINQQVWLNELLVYNIEKFLV